MDRGVIFLPSPQNRPTDLFGFAISVKFVAARVLTNVDKERSYLRDTGVYKE